MLFSYTLHHQPTYTISNHNMARLSHLLVASVLPLFTTASPALLGTYTQYAALAYSLVDTYTASNFFSDFSLFNGLDPTSGYVNYVSSLSTAQAEGLVNTDNNQIYMGVDYTTVNPASPGRNSVRLTSNKAYTHGLFIADIAHSK